MRLVSCFVALDVDEKFQSQIHHRLENLELAGKGMLSNTTVSVKIVNDYTRQLHVSAPTGHLQVVSKRT